MLFFQSRVKSKWQYIIFPALLLFCAFWLNPPTTDAMIPPATSICVRYPDVCFEGLSAGLKAKDLSGKTPGDYTAESIETYGEVSLKVFYDYSGENSNQTVNLKFYCDGGSAEPDKVFEAISEEAAQNTTYQCNYTAPAGKVFNPKAVIEKGSEQRIVQSGTIKLVGADIKGDLSWRETKVGATEMTSDGGNTSRRIEFKGKNIHYPGLQIGVKIIVDCGINAEGDRTKVVNKSSQNGGVHTAEPYEYYSFDNITCTYPSTLAKDEHDKRVLNPMVTVQRNYGAYNPLTKTYALNGVETIGIDVKIYDYTTNGSLQLVNETSPGSKTYNTSSRPVFVVKQSGYSGDKTLDTSTNYKLKSVDFVCTGNGEVNASGGWQKTIEADSYSFGNCGTTGGVTSTDVTFSIERGWATAVSPNSGLIHLNINNAPIVTWVNPSQSTDETYINQNGNINLTVNATDLDTSDTVSSVSYFVCKMNPVNNYCENFLANSDNYTKIPGMPPIQTLSQFMQSVNWPNIGDYSVVALAVDSRGAVGLSTPTVISVSDPTISPVAGARGLNLNYGVGNKQKEQ